VQSNVRSKTSYKTSVLATRICKRSALKNCLREGVPTIQNSNRCARKTEGLYHLSRALLKARRGSALQPSVLTETHEGPDPTIRHLHPQSGEARFN